MFYVIEVMKHGHKHPLALLSGPAGMDMAALEREWLGSVPNLEKADSEQFAVWLAGREHWSRLAYTRHTMSEYVFNLEDYGAVEALWGESYGIDDRLPCRGPYSRGYHSYDHVRLPDGTRVWGCCFCDHTRPLKVPV